MSEYESEIEMETQWKDNRLIEYIAVLCHIMYALHKFDFDFTNM